MLAYEKHGAGPPLVLIHGITHRRQAWYPVLEPLAAAHEVYLVDLPGHGQSPDLVTGGAPVADVLRAELGQFFTQVGLERPHLGGNSLGGMIALELAAAGWGRSVTAFSPAGFWRDERGFAYTKRLFALATAVIGHGGPAAERLARTSAGRAVLFGTLMSHPARLPAEVAVGDIRGFVRSMPAMREMLAAARPFQGVIPAGCPVTVAWAGRDLVLPAWEAAEARHLLPGATHLSIPGAGHVPMWDAPEAVASIILRATAA